MAGLVPIANLKGPQGVQGVQGLPGTNAVPSDDAVAGYIATGGTSATQVEGDKRYGRGVSVRQSQFGAVGDGVADDTAAFNAALAASKNVFIPEGVYKITASLVTGAGQTIWGASKHAARLVHAFNGDMFPNLAPYATVKDISIDGQGATFMGRCFVFSGSDNQQSLTRVRAINFDGAVCDFATSAGSGFTSTDCLFYRVAAGTGTGRFAVVIDPAQQLLAVPRKFVGMESGGQCAIDFGGSNNTELVASVVGDIGFDAGEARGVNILGCRLLNDLELTVDGHGVTIVGCDVLPAITIAAGADGVVIGPNAYNNLPVIDNSGNSRNQVTHHMVAYAPVLSSGGAAPTLGNGTLTGKSSRSGGQVRCVINLTIGSTTNLGSGEIRVSLPTPRSDGTIETVGRARIQIGATQYFADGDIPGAVGYVRLYRDGSGSVTATSPATFAAGDTVRMGFTYNV